MPQNSISFFFNPLIGLTREYFTGKTKAERAPNSSTIIYTGAPSIEDVTETMNTLRYGVNTGRIKRQNFDTEARKLLKQKTK